MKEEAIPGLLSRRTGTNCQTEKPRQQDDPESGRSKAGGDFRQLLSRHPPSGLIAEQSAGGPEIGGIKVWRNERRDDGFFIYSSVLQTLQKVPAGIERGCS